MRNLLISLAFLVALGWSSPAQSHIGCGPKEDILRLLEKYEETTVYTAIDHHENLVIVTASQSGTWTILIRGVEDITTLCIVMYGKDFNPSGDRT